VDVDGTAADTQASGEDLYDSLRAFNEGHLVASQNGALVGWSEDGVNVDVTFDNTPDAFWNVLADYAL
jgi:hypothetical protein